MRIARATGLTGLLLALAGCSSSPGATIDPEAWTPPGSDFTTVECAELLPEWGTGEEAAPVRCWTFEETTGLPDRFAALVDGFSDQAEARPGRGPSCLATMACTAEWEASDGVVTLSSSLTLTGLQAEVDAGIQAGPDTPRLYELTLWTADEPMLTDAEWEDLYEPLND